MKLCSRIRNLIPLRLGTIVTPKKPAGRRAVFYRDEEGNHWPVQPMRWLRKIILKGNPQKQIAILTPPWYFHSLLQQKKQAVPGEFKGLNTLPSGFKEEAFNNYNFALFLISARSPISEISWDKSGIHSDSLKIEMKTGTYYIERKSVLGNF